MKDRKRMQAEHLTEYQIQETALPAGDIFELIKQAKREWEATVDVLPQVICLLDEEQNVLRANRAVERWNLAEIKEVKGLRVHDLFHPGCQDTSCPFEGCLEESWENLRVGKGTTCKLEDKRLGRYLQIQVQPIPGTPKHRREDVGCAVFVVQDVTEEVEARQELECSRNYYQNLLNNLHDQVVVIDDQNLIQDANQVFLDNISRPREEILGEPCYRVIHGLDQPCSENGMDCPVVDVMETGQTKRSLHAHAPENALGKRFDVVACPLEELNRDTSRFILAFRDVTTEQRLKDSLDGVYELGRELIFTRDPRTIIQTALDTAQILIPRARVALWLRNETKNVLVRWGYSDGTHVAVLDEVPVDKRIGLVTKALTRGEIAYDYLSSSDANDGEEERGISALAVPLQARSRVMGILSVEGEGAYTFDMRDEKILSTLAIQIAVALENAHLYEAEREQRKLLEQSQAQLVQSEKLAATGRLTASLAHEINNPLQAIHNSLQIMLAYEIDEDEKEEYLSMVNEDVTRLINMVERMLDFARKPQQKKKVLDINQIIEKTFNLSYKYLQHSNIKLAKHLGPDLPPVRINEGEMKQVFLNLLVNAVDAMEDGGKLEVSSYRENEHLEVVFSDTGKGIAAEDMDRIFEPFFSTKEEGTGLGLSTSYKIIQQHGGDLEVRSEKGRGSTFTVRLPL
jgi:signal transduction histidine kinase